MEKQRSKEWFDKRKGRVTGSVAGAILGLSPWRTPEDVLRAMVRAYHGAPREFTGNVMTEYGAFHEAGAAIEYTMETGNPVMECGFFEHESWLGASPDGLVSFDGIIEIKCPWGKRKTGAFKDAKDQLRYYAQMQIEMLCADRLWCDFYQWSPVGTSLERVYRDSQWIIQNVPKLHAFYDRFLLEIDNPAHLEPLRAQIDAKDLIDEYDRLSNEIEIATAGKKDVLERIISLAGGKNAEIEGRKLTLVERAPSVSWSKACKTLLPDADLSEFMGKPSKYWRLS